MAPTVKSIGEKITQVELERQALQVQALAEEIRRREPGVYKRYLGGFKLDTPSLVGMIGGGDRDRIGLLGGRLAEAQRRAKIDSPKYGWPSSLDSGEAALNSRITRLGRMKSAAGDEEGAANLLWAGKREKGMLERTMARDRAKKTAWEKEYRTVKGQAMSSNIAESIAEEAARRDAGHAMRGAGGTAGKLYTIERHLATGERSLPNNAAVRRRASKRLIGPSQARRDRLPHKKLKAKARRQARRQV